MDIKIVLAKGHETQKNDPEIEMERASVEKELNSSSLGFLKDVISVVVVKGIYKHDERRMTTVCVFINNAEYTISEIRGKLKLAFRNNDAKIAVAAIDFDEEFLGVLNPKEGVLVHLNFPVKGLSENQVFSHSSIAGEFTDVYLKKEERKDYER